MTNHIDKLRRFFDLGVMAIIRIEAPAAVIPTVDALLKGGLDVIEISLVTPHAVDYIGQIHDQYGEEVMIGAGTVLDPPSARAAILAGADFIVSPVVRREMITLARRYGKLSFAGAYTPSECLLAWESGSDAVKLFPAMPAGPAYLEALNAPMKQIPLIAVGGVTIDNLNAFLKAGAIGVAGASNLVNPQLVREGHFEEITRTARAWVKVVGEARGVS